MREGQREIFSVGMTVATRNGQTIVIAVPGSPAAKAGLRPGT
jgi:predicted metalloprotease with PDZ domain